MEPITIPVPSIRRSPPRPRGDYLGGRQLGLGPPGRGPERRGAQPGGLACLQDQRRRDPLLDELARELERRPVLEVLREWIDEFSGSADNNAPSVRRLMRLFEVGFTPERVEGHHDGVAFGLRTGDATGRVASHANIMNLLWTAAVGKEAPWVGKSFAPAEEAELSQYTAGAVRAAGGCYIGVNHFRSVPTSASSRFFFRVLGAYMPLRKILDTERSLYGHDKNGGLLVARKARSVWHGSPRDVFQLNYRWRGLGNRAPFCWLIDELVELDVGLYLGQLLFATRRLGEAFDPSLPDSEYRYQHFGHFMLMDDSWAQESRRVFGHLGPGAVVTPLPSRRARKFTTFTFADPPDGNVDDRVLRQVEADLRRSDNIIHLFASYARALRRGDEVTATFARLDEIFNRGIAPRELRGYLRGALVSFQTEGYYRLFGVNTLNRAWRLGRWLSPWTGKRFEDISRDRLHRYTDGFERGEVPTFWGANTLVFRTPGEKLIQLAMRGLRIWMEPPPEYARGFRYDAESFFFIGRQGESILAANHRKRVFQFNYRWPKLRTFPPDHWCIDEVVQVADGLYLGQLTYATDLTRAYDPRLDPSVYQYRVFGYFLLMDEQWQRLRLEVGLDPGNV